MIWKDIPGYEGLYQVSNIGTLKSLSKLRKMGVNNKVSRLYPEKILFTAIKKNGYKMINLHKNNTSKSFYIHRLVAKTFIPNPENKSEVNHKDGDKSNNHVENLEWCSSSENLKHSYDQLGRKSSGGRAKRAIIAIKDGQEIEFESLTAASIQLKIGLGNIGNVLKGWRTHASGYLFKYKAI